MSVLNDEERALLDDYAGASAPSPSEIERALTRTLARIESGERAASLPNRPRRFVWAAAAGLATLAIASAAVAGVRWYRAQPKPQAESYGAARLDHADDRAAARASERADAATPTQVEPTPEPPAAVEVASESDATIDAEPAPQREPAPRRRSDGESARPQPAAKPDVTPSDSPSPDASELAAESRLLGLMRRALRDDDFAAALAWAREHERSYPRGALTEERLILEAVAACRGDQRERGLAALEQLREQFPSTVALAKVEQTCASE